MPSTDLEQALLELVNATRLDPQGTAARYIESFSPLRSSDPGIQLALDFFEVNGALLAAQFSVLAPAQPLAWSSALGAAAQLHTEAMVAAGVQSHQLPGEPALAQRLLAQGYSFTRAAENVFGHAFDPLHAHAAFMVDWGYGNDGIQSPPGHRQTILDPLLREIGIGIVSREEIGTGLGPLVVTENYGSRGSAGAIVLGVAFADTNLDRLYSVGEGRAGLNVSIGLQAASSSSSGGYALAVGATGAQTVQLTGGGLAAPVTAAVTLSDGLNAKLDVVDGTVLRTSVSVVVSGPIALLQGLGLAGLALGAGDGAIRILGTPGDDTLTGGAGNDTLDGGLGADAMTGGSGDDLFHVDHVGDGVDESVGGGAADTVLASVSYTLPAGSEIENLILASGALDATGNAFANTIVGNALANTIRGGGAGDVLGGGDGNDTLYGDAGEDQLYGERGDDWIFGGDDYDLIFGGEGNDLIVGQGAGDIVFAQSGNDLVDGGAGTDVLFGQEDNDVIFGDEADDQLIGGGGNDTLMGERGGLSLTGGNDWIYGDDEVLSLVGGDDLINGGGGNDILIGNGGNDVIDGGHGNDIVEGNAGADLLVGSAASLAGPETNGSDLFIYRAMTDAGDSIHGFDIRAGNNDGIDLRPLFDALGYAGTTARAEGYLRLSQSGANALVEIDADGAANGANFTTLVTLVDRAAVDVSDGFFLFQ